jgi:hypothetical protein
MPIFRPAPDLRGFGPPFTLAKFRCYDLLLDAFGGEDRRVINLNDALLLECRKYLDRTAPWA